MLLIPTKNSPCHNEFQVGFEILLGGRIGFFYNLQGCFLFGAQSAYRVLNNVVGNVAGCVKHAFFFAAGFCSGNSGVFKAGLQLLNLVQRVFNDVPEDVHIHFGVVIVLAQPQHALL